MNAAKPSADRLARYRAKRDFRKTPEPSGSHAPQGMAGEKGRRFIVQKHAATRLHWDFRMEIDGVLKSWAVTKGPSPDPEIKRLAVRTEDHPLAYADFEGVIPKGEYGGGSVMLWDRGRWEPVLGKSATDLEKGHLHFILHGERMKGEWLLVRLKPRAKEKGENWLLRKIADEFAAEGDPLVEQALTSVLTGRTMAEIAVDKTGKDFLGTMASAARHNSTVGKGRKRNKPALPETFRPVQLATLVDTVPHGNNWMHEIKFDGYRALVSAMGEKVRIHTRNGLDWTDKFAPLVESIGALDLPSCLIDGEIVAYGADGNPEFSSLQKVLKRGQGEQGPSDTLAFHAFDLLALAGQDITSFPNIERKERLEALLAHANPPIYVADHVIGAGERLLAAMCQAEQEGIISKRIDAPYVGSRTRNWLKVKCILRQEFVVIGGTRSSARGRPFASLLLGQYEGRKLVYRGKVGTGFDADILHELNRKMTSLATDNPPADVPRAEARGALWIRPKLVVEVAFAEFTAEGRVRHASFVALREDKPASKVKPERATHLSEAEEDAVEISNRDRVIYPGSGQTKGDLADYYRAIAPLMMPFVAGRPISLVRCPQGYAKKCFFQKHDSGSFGPSVKHVPIVEKAGGTEDYLYIENAEGLLSCVQMGTIEFHGWGAKAEDVELPDRMIFDLDPDAELDFADVKRAARDIRQQLADLGLASYPMLSGGKGVHVLVPLTPGHDWETHKDFARRFAEALSLAQPDRFVANMRKARRKRRIFIDWLRNQRGSTAVVPYSARARAHAPVAVPVSWNELDDIKKASAFTIADTTTLMKRSRQKALQGWGFAAQVLPQFV